MNVGLRKKLSKGSRKLLQLTQYPHSFGAGISLGLALTHSAERSSAKCRGYEPLYDRAT